MSTIDHLLTLASAYGAAEGIEPTTVSYRAFKDSKKLRALVAGATITITRADAVTLWFSRNWPAKAPWPPGVPRPEAAKADGSPLAGVQGAAP